MKLKAFIEAIRQEKAEEQKKSYYPPYGPVVYQCKRPDCFKAFPDWEALADHHELDYHCEKCGFGNSDRMPQGLKKQMGYCAACAFESLPVGVDDEKGQV